MSATKVLTKSLAALGSLALLLLLVVGVPLALTSWGDIAVLWHTDWAAAVTAPVSVSVVVGVISALGWLCWFWLVLGVVAEGIALITRGRVHWRVPGAAWLQPTLATLLALVVAGLAATADSGYRHASPHGAQVVVSSAAVQAETPRASAPATAVHVVSEGDELWTIAEQRYGDGQQWRTIADANGLAPDQALPVGARLTLPGLPSATGASVMAGPTLQGPEHRPDEVAASLSTHPVVVQRGDTLWHLAEVHLGDPERWPEIAQLNQQIILDPDEIEVGWVVQVPTSAGSVEQTPAAVPSKPPAEPAPSTPAPITPAPSLPASPSATPSAQAETSPEAGLVTADPVRLAGAGVTASLAALVGAGLLVRRRLQQGQRSVGRRPIPPDDLSLRTEAAWQASAATSQTPDDPTPTTAVIGECPDGRVVSLDLMDARLTVVRGTPDPTTALVGGIATSLACAEWSATTQIVAVGRDLAWTVGLEAPMLRAAADVDRELAAAAVRASDRRAAGDDHDDTLHEVLLIGVSLTADQRDQVIELLDETPGMAAVVIDGPGSTPWVAGGVVVHLEDEEHARVGRGETFLPSLISEPARRALVELHRSVTTDETEQAPWWADDPPGAVRVIHNPPEIPDHREEADMEAAATQPNQPTLLLLGPVSLVGARGTRPNRAVKQCEEYCGWLLENPGRNSSMMASQLMVAEATRRSNISRLRSWLGSDDEGSAYLPEAYTGKIVLHPSVTSDWEHLQLLISAGVNRTPSQALVDALELVRGEPLADVAPGQWTWAGQWRTDMIATVRDIAAVLATRSLDGGDTEVADWALRKGRACSPSDEVLLALTIRLEHQRGNQAEAERHIVRLTRQARATGTDLRDDTVTLIQEVMEGRARNRQA